MVLFGSVVWTKVVFLTLVFLSALCAGIAAVCGRVSSWRRQWSHSRELEDERERLLKGVEPIGSYFGNLTTLNWKSLQGRYALVEQQCRRTFVASILVGLAGFILIAAGLAVGIGLQSDVERGRALVVLVFPTRTDGS